MESPVAPPAESDASPPVFDPVPIDMTDANDGAGDSTSVTLGEDPIADPSSIADATWGVAARVRVDGDDFFLVVGSSFVVDEGRLVTNAHVIEAALELLPDLDPEMDLVVVQHESKTYCPIKEWYIHPDYDTVNSLSTPDLGVVLVDCELPSAVPVADIGELHDLTLLQDVTLCGFPGDVTLLDLSLGSTRPRATCLTGNITGFRPFDLNQATTPLNTAIIQHDIQTSGGTSGGPIFDKSGRVVAINSAGTTDPTASNRFAIRVDSVWPLLSDIDAGRIAPVDLTAAKCLNTEYWNRTYSFGFDPPSGFSGPFKGSTLFEDELFSVEYVFDDLLKIEVGVLEAFGTLDTWVDTWVATASDENFLLLDNKTILMPSGIEAVRLEWRRETMFSLFYSIELWSVQDGFLYYFRAFMSPTDFANLGNAVRTSLNSACVE